MFVLSLRGQKSILDVLIGCFLSVISGLLGDIVVCGRQMGVRAWRSSTADLLWGFVAVATDLFIFCCFFFFFLMTGAEVCYPVEMVHSIPLTNAFVIINLFFNHFCMLVSISRPPHHPTAAVSCPQTHNHFSRSFPPVVLSTPSHTHTHTHVLSLLPLAELVPDTNALTDRPNPANDPCELVLTPSAFSLQAAPRVPAGAASPPPLDPVSPVGDPHFRHFSSNCAPPTPSGCAER